MTFQIISTILEILQSSSQVLVFYSFRPYLLSYRILIKNLVRIFIINLLYNLKISREYIICYQSMIEFVYNFT